MQKKKEVNIMELYEKGATIDEIAQQLYAEKHCTNPEYLTSDARITVENTVLESKIRKVQK